MAIFKCKMCGGDLNIQEGNSVCECEYCGTNQTIPAADNEKKINLFNRANRLRFKNDFDKAEALYESIISEYPEEAEAYWGICLCKYGIEYVDDPATARKIPTCHRTSFKSIFDEENYKIALENADVVAQKVYRDEARAIDTLQKDILAVVNSAEPYDVFVCYKETGDNGERTHDSVLAQDIYDELSEKGLKVFFSRITLEDKLGTQYEPYIFAALNSAKVMLVVGTKYEHFNAVWVKNEWSRYLDFMKADHKKVLIPCYKDMDPYDLPDEFSNIQAQDMNKIGAMQDLVRGVLKITNPVETAAPVQTVVQQVTSSNAANLLKRGFMALEEGDWANADKFFEEALNADAECAQAYVGKYLVQHKFNSLGDILHIVQKVDNETASDKKRLGDPKRDNIIAAKYEEFVSRDTANSIFQKHLTYSTRTENLKKRIAREESIFEQDRTLQKALRFADEEYKKQIVEAQNKFFSALDSLIAKSEENDNAAVQSFESKYKKADDELRKIYEQNIQKRKRAERERIEREQKEKIAREKQRKEDYDRACEIQERLSQMNFPKKTNDLKQYIETLSSDYSSAEHIFHGLGDYLDSKQREKECMNSRIQKIDLAQKEIQRIKAQKTRNGIIGVISVCIAITACIAIPKYIKQKMLDDKTSLYLEALSNNPSGIPTCIDAGRDYTIGLKPDGSVVSVGKSPDWEVICDWTDVVDLGAGTFHTIGLKSDGTVVTAVASSLSQCDYSDWNNIIAVSAGWYHSVGLKSDGTVVAEGDNDVGQCNVSDWNDIVAISAGYEHTVGIKSDGTVVAVGDNGDGQCNVSGWSDIVAISAGTDHTVGLKSDGTVVAVGDNYQGQCNVSDWKNIISISAGGGHTVGLKVDGTVVAVGDNKDGRCWVSDWNDIVAISAGYKHTVGLKSDGTVVTVGNNEDGQCSASHYWEGIKTPNIYSD